MVASMSSGGFEDNEQEVMEKLNELAEKHYNTKGLIHTSSYPRAERVEELVNADDHPYLHENIFVHNGDEEPEVQIEKWQNSDKDLFLSPSMMEGISLDGDRGKWQVLLKIPYPPMDSRTKYITQETKHGWMEYFERAMIRVVQSYGRTIRSKTDKSDYYILDKDFDKLMKRRKAPEWFTEALGKPPVNDSSVFDY
jgi:Rad3-related DNA helicase